MNRLDSLRVIDEVFRERPLVVTCGATTRELASIAKKDSHLYLLDSMGLAAAVGVGLALAGRGPLAAIEGDGSLLMGLPVLSTISYLRPAGFTLIVLDNREHASAGRFPTQAKSVGLADACRGFGLPTEETSDPVALRSTLERSLGSEGPSVVIGSIEGGNAPGTPFLLDDPAVLANGFRRFLEGGA